MKVVVDTNVFISGVFFGGKPQRVLEKIVDGEVCGLCSVEILNEYRGIIKRMVEKKGGTLNPGFLNPFYSKLQFVAVSTVVKDFLTRFSRVKLIPYVLLFPMSLYKDDDYDWGSD